MLAQPMPSCGCLSITFVNSVRMSNRIFKFFSPSGSQTILVFPHQLLWQYSDGNPPKGGVTGVTLGKEVFTDLDFAGDVSLLAEMLEVLVLALTVKQEGAFTFGLQINWSKTKILQVPSSSSSSTVQVADGHVEAVNAFVYLGCMIDFSGGSRGEVLRQIGLARSCMNMLDRTGGSRSQASGWKPS